MNSPLTYIGGKSKLAATIIDMIPDHRSYCEVFAGAGWVFFRKEPSRFETINDLDSELICFYRVLQNHLEEFVKQFKWILCSREWWEDWERQAKAGGLTDIQQAARYYYLQRCCFAGRVKGRTYGSPGPMGRPGVNLLRIEQDLSDAHIRLARVHIENLPWQEFLRRYDRAETLFYLDPPYHHAPVYKSNMVLKDYEQLAEILVSVKAKFILSINDHPDMNRTFKAFKIRKVSLAYSASRAKTTKGKELLITNF